jgi:hypothetical protein
VGTAGARCGRLFAMSDPSAVMNLMMRYPGNRAFAGELIDYLVADDAWGPRGGNLYLVSGAFDQAGVFGSESLLERSIADHLQSLGDWVGRLSREGLPKAMAWLIAALTTLGVIAFSIKVATRPYTRPMPRYARATPLIAQGGLAGRAAVLGAPSTSRALLVLELQSAFEAAVRDRLSLDRNASSGEVRASLLSAATLTRAQLAELDAFFDHIRAAERALSSSRQIRVTQEAIARMKEAMSDILASLPGDLTR